MPIVVDNLFEQLKLGCPDSYDAATAAASQNAWTFFHRECREHGYTMLEVQAMYKAVKGASHLEHVALDEDVTNEMWDGFFAMKPAAAAKAELLAAAGAWNAFLHAIRGTKFTLEERLDMFYEKRLKALGPLPDAEPVQPEPSLDDIRRVQAIKAAAATAAAAARVAARSNAKNAAKLAAKAAQKAQEAERLAKAKGVDLSARSAALKAASKQAKADAAEAALKAQEAAVLAAAAEAEAAEQAMMAARMNSERNMAVAQAAIAALERPGLPALKPLLESIRRSRSVAEVVSLVSAELAAEVEVEEEEAAGRLGGESIAEEDGEGEDGDDGEEAGSVDGKDGSGDEGAEELLGDEDGTGHWPHAEREGAGPCEDEEGDGEQREEGGEEEEQDEGEESDREQEAEAGQEDGKEENQEREGAEEEGDNQAEEENDGGYIGVGGVDGDATQQRQSLFATSECDGKKVRLSETKTGVDGHLAATQAEAELSLRQLQEEPVQEAPARRKSGFLCCFTGPAATM
jgi:hypothetical protein